MRMLRFRVAIAACLLSLASMFSFPALAREGPPYMVPVLVDASAFGTVAHEIDRALDRSAADTALFQRQRSQFGAFKTALLDHATSRVDASPAAAPFEVGWAV